MCSKTVLYTYVYVHTVVIHTVIVLTVRMITLAYQVYEFLILSQGDYRFQHRRNKA